MTKQSDAIKTAPKASLPAGVVRPTMWADKVFKDTSVSLLKDMGAMQDRVTEWSVQALMHLEAHKDVATLNRFIVGMPKGYKRNAMAEWFLAFGCVRVNTDKGTAQLSPLSYDKTKQCLIEDAMAKPWHEFQPSKPIDTVFDLQRAVHMLLQRAKGKAVLVNGKPLDPEMANDLLKAMGAMVGESYTAEPAAVKVPAPEVPVVHSRREGDVVPEQAAPEVVAKAVKPKGKKPEAALL